MHWRYSFDICLGTTRHILVRSTVTLRHKSHWRCSFDICLGTTRQILVISSHKSCWRCSFDICLGTTRHILVRTTVTMSHKSCWRCSFDICLGTTMRHISCLLKFDAARLTYLPWYSCIVNLDCAIYYFRSFRFLLQTWLWYWHKHYKLSEIHNLFQFKVIFFLHFTHNFFAPGLRPLPRWGAYSAPQTPSWSARHLRWLRHSHIQSLTLISDHNLAALELWSPNCRTASCTCSVGFLLGQ